MSDNHNDTSQTTLWRWVGREFAIAWSRAWALWRCVIIPALICGAILLVTQLLWLAWWSI